jgi:GNAT superfamily N-acetyltransferase
MAAVHVAAWRESYAGLLPADFLARMSVDARRSLWRREIAAPRPGGALFVAEQAGAVVGFVSAGPQRDDARLCDAEIYALYLLRAAQGRGLGRALMRAAAGVALRWGAASLDLWALEGNARAAGFYRAMGGAPEARRRLRVGGGWTTERAWVWADLAAAPFARAEDQ